MNDNLVAVNPSFVAMMVITREEIATFPGPVNKLVNEKAENLRLSMLQLLEQNGYTVEFARDDGA